MKKNLICVLCLVALVIALFPLVSLRSSAATSDGMTFKSKLYQMSRRLEDAPYTFVATLCLASGVEDGGVIVTNYEKQSQAFITFEIVENGNVKLKFANTKWTSASYKDTEDADGVSEVLFDGYDVRTGDFVDIVVVNETPDFKLYVDGALVQTVTATPTASETFQYYSKALSRNEFCVGTQNNKNGTPNYDYTGDDYFKGTLKEVALYKTTLSASEVKKLYAGGAQDDDARLIAHYDFAKYSTSTVVPDLSGNSYTLSIGYYDRTAEEQEALSGYAYSFAIVGDTQNAVNRDWQYYDYNSVTPYVYDYLVKYKTEKNIQYVFGVGDITEYNGSKGTNAESETEWSLAQAEFKKLDDAEIPWSVIPGDHDKTNDESGVFDYRKYNEALGGSDFTLASRITGTYDQSGENSYSADYTINNYYINFEVENTEYMLLALEVNPNDEIVAWANGVIAANPERRVIITTHAYLWSDGSLLTADKETSYDGVGKRLWENLVSLHPNVLMVLCGHIPTENLVVSQQKGVYGNTVTQILVNPQYNDPNHSTIGMLYFSEDGTHVGVELIGAGASSRNNSDKLYRPDSKFELTLISEEGKGIHRIACIESSNTQDVYRIYYTNGTYNDYTVSKSDLMSAINSKADAATVSAALKELSDSVAALEAVKNNYATADEGLKAELEAKILTAKSEAIEAARALVEASEATLQAAVNSKADSATVSAALQELSDSVAALEAVKNDYATADEGLKAELEAKILTAKSEAIEAARALVEASEATLQAAVNLKADSAIVSAALQELSDSVAALEAVKNNYAAADEGLKAELEAEIASAKAESKTAIEALSNSNDANANPLSVVALIASCVAICACCICMLIFWRRKKA